MDMYTEDEKFRMAEVARVNGEAAERKILEERHGKVWSTDEMCAEFQVLGFGAPFIHVRRRADGKEGSLQFQHSPRFYFYFYFDFVEG